MTPPEQADQDARDRRDILAGEEPEAVRIELLGRFRISVGARPIEEGEWRLRKAASLVKLLALEPDHRLHRERAMNLLWPELDAKAAANNLRYVLHAARRTLEPASAATLQYLYLQGDLLVLCPNSPCWVDVEAFEFAAARARRSHDNPAAYRVAIDLYAGELLPEDRYEPWVEERREGLRLTYIALLVEMAELHEQREEFGPAVEVLRKVVASEPTHEGAHVGLMRLYARTGQRNPALRQYERLRQALQQELGTEPDWETRSLCEESLARRFPPTEEASPPEEEPQGARQHNLPASRTSFVGREREMVEVMRLLATTRLLTLTGAGGSGKTRLALEVARDLVGAYPDGVWLVELAGLSEGELVPQVMAEALKIREQPNRLLTEILVDALRFRHVLLVLDNCEHLIDACARLMDVLLGSCPGVRVLATSREPLNVAGEVVWPVSSLSVPDAERPLTVAGLKGYESARLFVERALYRPSAFVLTAEIAQTVAEICQQLDGMPLAIELAAARVGTLAVSQISERLGDSLKLLTGGGRTATPRQQTLRGALDWSYELLNELEQRLFGRLSVFAGGWELEAAEVVGASGGIDKGDVLDLLSRLGDKSLVAPQATEAGGMRYRILEPIRQYAQERLEESGEGDAARRRHATYFLGLAEEAEPKLMGPRQEAWLERLEREHDNLRAALSWSLENEEAELGLRLSGALAGFWYMLGRPQEGRRWLEATLANGYVTPAQTRAKALNGAGRIAWEQGDYERSRTLSEESLTLCRKLGDEAGVAMALYNLGAAALFQNEYEQASTLLEETATLQRALGDTRGLARTLPLLGGVALAQQDYDRAAKLHEESAMLARMVEDSFALVLSLGMGAFAALGQGDHRQTRLLCEEGLKTSWRLKIMHVLADQLRIVAASAGAQGQPVRLARLWGAAEALRETMGVDLSPVERYFLEPYIATARSQLNEAAWEAAWAEGRQMTPEQAVEYALSEREEPTLSVVLASEEPSAERQMSVLTSREEEVAILIAQGLTNHQIAAELVLSERTIHRHVGKILKKLKLRSRTQIATWIVEQRPVSSNPD